MNEAGKFKVNSAVEGMYRKRLTLVNRLKAGLLAIVEANTKLDLGNCAFAKVADATRCGS